MAEFDPTKYGARKLTNIPPSSGSDAGIPPVIPKDTYGAILPATGKETLLQAGGKALVNIPSSAFNLAKGVVGAVAHPIETGKGIIGTAVGAAEKLIPGVQPQERYADALGSYFKERYGSIENAQKTAINDPFGFGTDVLALVSGGAGLAGKTGELSKAISTVAKPVTAPISKATELAGAGIKEVATGAAGATTGVGKEAFTQALKNEPGFTEGLRNKINITDVLNQAQSGLSDVKKMRATEYSQAMDNLKTLNPQTLDISPVLNKAKELTQKFNIKMGSDGTLDLSRSPLVNDASKVNAVFDLLDSWGTQAGDRTIAGVDLLKRQLRDFREPTNPTLTKFVDDLSKSAGEIASGVEGYSGIMKKYGNYSDFIDQLQRTLSLKESATPDQAITKLNSLLRDNADYRRMLVDELKSATGKDIMAPIAGKALSKIAPQGLSKYVAVGAGATMPTLIPYIAFASPRVMGELFRLIGITSKTAGNIFSDINNLRIGAGLAPIKAKVQEVNKTMAGKGGMSIQDVSKSPLLTEARKYKTAEDFVKARGNYYHTSKGGEISQFNKTGEPIYFSQDKNFSQAYQGKEGINTNVSLDLKKTAILDDKKLTNILKDSYFADQARYPTVKDVVDDFNMSDVDLRRYVFGKLKKQGYDSAVIKNDWNGGFGKMESTVVFDASQIKTKSQLTDIWNKAHATLPKAEVSLVSEARKYKTAEEFVRKHEQIAQFTDEGKDGKFWTVPSGADEGFGSVRKDAFVDTSKIYNRKTNSRKFLEERGLLTQKMQKTIDEAADSSDPNIEYKITQDAAEAVLKKEGYAGAKWIGEDDLNPTQYQIWDKSIVQTRSQLTDIWKKANKK